MAFHGGLVGCIIAIVLFGGGATAATPGRARPGRRGATPRGPALGAACRFIDVQLQGRLSGRARASRCSPAEGPCRGTPASPTRQPWRGSSCCRIVVARTRRPRRQTGVVGGTFMLGYGLARSFCELFREPDPGHVLTFGPVTAGIVYSLPMIAIGLWILREVARRPAPAPADAQRPADSSSLLQRLRETIARDGPMPIDRYMQACPPIPSMATGSERPASARAAISSPRPRSARCSAS